MRDGYEKFDELALCLCGEDDIGDEDVTQDHRQHKHPMLTGAEKKQAHSSHKKIKKQTDSDRRWGKGGGRMEEWKEKKM